jgi:ABC-2 type transport system permease protein
VRGRLPSSGAGDDGGVTSLEELRERVRAASEGSDEDLAALASDVRALADDVEQVSTVPPDVLARPFDSETETVLPERIDPTAFFGPTSIALLLQHLALTLAALSLMRDKRTGLFEVLRVGPLSSLEILVGKFVAHIAIGGLVATALLAAAVGLLDVPMQGEVLWLVPVVLGVVAASLGLGMLLSSISSTESQAVQWAMLVLLAAMFFGGFVLSLEDLAYPVKLLSWTLPVTYGIRAFQTVMLRGEPPAVEDLVGLAATTAVYVTLAVLALRRNLRNV